MPNNVNLGIARTVQAALMHTANNGLKFNRYGAAQAMLSPAVQEVRTQISPYGPTDSTSVIWGATPGRDILVPKVQVNTYPARVVSGYDERTRDLNGEDFSDPLTIDVVYDFYKEIKVNRSLARELFEPKALEYMSNYVAGKMSDTLDPKYKVFVDRLALQIIQDFDSGVANPFATYVLSSLIARIGKNAAFPTANAPTAAAPLIEVPTFNADRTLKAEFWDFINETKIANKITGRLIMIGGTLALRAMRREGVLAINDAGYDWATMFGRTPVDFYYDELIDTIYGAGRILLIDSGAAAAETFCYADFPEKFGDPTNSDDTADAKGKIMFMNLPEDETILNNVASSFIRDVDVRVTRKRDANDFAVTTATVALPAGLYIRPNGWFTEDVTNVLHGVSGIFAAKLI
ncbi:hypothetical protein [Dyadobacter sp. CY347]|uniref:hypothetical protein n=1 Tax=Dyadobacter sp. CY347 TaxID=2909336 RepID=UPI001F1F1B44|nr:hypothetical protein [Dyadobacter sp. CY347]MCF2487472.1 hypothetical protein [Dyadobacter sp. CY347]